MSKGLWKKALGLGLAVIMTAGLAACGNNDDGGGQGSGGGLGGGGSAAGNANSSLAKEYVYSYDPIDLGDYGDNISIRQMQYIDGRMYVLLEIYVYQGQPVGDDVRAAAEALGLIVDDQAQDAAEEDTGEGDEEAIDEYVPPAHIVRVLSFLPDGSDKQYFDLDMGENSEKSWLNYVTFGKDATLYAVRENYFEDYSDPENPIYEDRQELICWGNDGTQVWSTDLTELQEQEGYYYINNMLAAEDGSVQLLTYGDEMKLISVDAEGNITGSKAFNIANSQNINSIFQRQDGSLLIITADDSWSKLYASSYDPETGTEGERTELPGNMMMYSMYQGTYTDLLLTNNQGLYTYNIGDSEVKQLMSYVNSDLDATYLNGITMLDEEHFIAYYNDMVDYNLQVAYFTRVDPKDIPDKKVLVLGANYLSSDVRKRVIEFNKSDSQYRITLRDYSTYNTMDDYMAGYTQMNNDIIAGKMPDIIMVDTQIPVENYIAKGLIADIGSLIEKDEELSQTEFLENVFEAFSVDGTLYYVVPTFSVNTMIGKKTLIGDRTGWNMEEFQEVLAQQPEGTSAFGDITRDGFFWQIMQYCGSDFVDLSTGKCKFDSQEFINMLEFAKTLPEEINYDEDYNWEDYESQYRDNRTLLMSAYIYSVRDMNYSINGQFGEEVAFVGFPNENRNGSIVRSDSAIVLSSKSTDLEGAWEFVRYYLTDEYQSTVSWQMPVNKEMFLAKAQEATQRPYYLDENGEKIEYDDTMWINGESIPLPPMSQETVDQITTFIQSVNRVAYYNNDIQNIISEEVGPFFEGQKTAEEVANIIQNRVQIYVNESR